MAITQDTTYSDPDMIHVGSFASSEGRQSVAQKGANFFHFTEVIEGPNPMEPKKHRRSVRSAKIYRTPEGTVYELEWGSPPSSEVMGKIVGMLPQDMRGKKVIIKKPDTVKF